MKKLMIMVLVLVTVGSGYAYGDTEGLVPYVSPGLAIGYNTQNKCLSIIPKVSLGISHFGRPHVYVNVTVGYNILTRRTPQFDYPGYFFTELQGGTYLIGGGIGYAFLKKEGEKTLRLPKYSWSLGALLYVNGHMVKMQNGTMNTTTGLKASLPIPLVYVDLF